jgi:hypothetical protein
MATCLRLLLRVSFSVCAPGVHRGPAGGAGGTKGSVFARKDTSRAGADGQPSGKRLIRNALSRKARALGGWPRGQEGVKERAGRARESWSA